MKYEIRVPTYIMLGESKFRLNLNSYRNWNYHVSNAVKVKFGEEMEDKIPEKINGPVNITYQLFEKAKNRKDKGNILSIVQKFLLDAITLKKAWPDDNDKVVKTETFLPTASDPEKKWFVLVTITEIDDDFDQDEHDQKVLENNKILYDHMLKAHSTKGSKSKD